MRKFFSALFLTSFLFAFQIAAVSQTSNQLAQNSKPAHEAAPPAVSYHYKFENERFTTPLQELEFDGSGRGQFRFKKKESEEIVNDLTVSSLVLSQVQSLFSQLNFLASQEDYQHKKDFSHLGTVTISQSQNGKERTVKFNYSDNPAMSQLREIFQNLVNQETRFFELETVRATDPLSTPAQMRILDDDLKSKRIADPQRFVPLLKDLKLDEGVPLITRNHAERLLQRINKEK
jgi:hypothetical protein